MSIIFLFEFLTASLLVCIRISILRLSRSRAQSLKVTNHRGYRRNTYAFIRNLMFKRSVRVDRALALFLVVASSQFRGCLVRVEDVVRIALSALAPFGC